MGWNIRGNRVLSDQELRKENDAVVFAVFLLGVPALVCWGAYSLIGMEGPLQKISIIIIGILTLGLTLKFIHKIISATFILFGLAVGGVLLFGFLQWLFK